jgi:DNA-binding response OmpR family regulator
MKKILIIEDELSYLKLLREQLVKNGYEVSEAKDGKKGLAAAKSQHPDLILLDLGMPEMDGMTVLTELRKDTYGNSAKVIILTNLDPDDKILRAVLVDKPSYYFMKSDIKLAELIEKIKEIFLSDKKEG